MKVKVTNHGEDRLKQRLSVSKKNISKEAAKAFDNGIAFYDTTGKMRRYLDALRLRGSDGHSHMNPKVYHRHVYVFDFNGTLITVFQLPHYLNDAEDKLKKKLSSESQI